MSLLLRGFSKEDREVLLHMWRWLEIAFWVSIASLIVAIAAIITAILW